MEIKYVLDHMIFDVIVGSQAYGLDTTESDVDKAGVMIPGRKYFYGLDKFEQFQDFPGEDHTVYDIRKAIRLIADNNPNMMDLLWSPERCIIKIEPYWQRVIDDRDLFLSKKSKYTFSGYAIAQLERIETHRHYLLNPPKKMPERSDYNLPANPLFPTTQLKAFINASMHDFLVQETRDTFFDELDAIYGDYIMPLFWKHTKEHLRTVAMEWLQLGLKSQFNTLRSLGPNYIKDEYLDLAEREIRYYHACHEWQRYKQWSKTRNKKRAELELKFGFDVKHASHLVRLMRMGKEILTTGKVNVDRTGIDAQELKAIKQYGTWSFEQLKQYAVDMDKLLDQLYKTSKLQNVCQMDKINELCTGVVDEWMRDHFDDKY